ncbi:MAG TPA: hypothetical protein VH593_10935 [Ktedonobacteraceae bacterium]
MFLDQLLRKSVPGRQLSIYLHSHLTIAARTVLFGGELLILLAFAYVWQTGVHPQGYSMWLAGLAMTLGLLLLLVRISAFINGYVRYHDRWVEFAIVFIFFLGLIMFISTLLA